MNDVLSNMDPQKRDRLINSSLEEFGQNMFEKASTNTIVKNAGISKGLMYHYFSSKDSLYQYIETFSIKILADSITENISWETSDLLQRVKEIALVKFKVFTRYPPLISFTKTLHKNKSLTDLKELIEAHVPGIYHQIYRHNIDFDLFKDDLDKGRAIKLIQWTIENLCEEWHIDSPELDSSFTKLEKEIDIYLMIFKDAFYK